MSATEIPVGEFFRDDEYGYYRSPNGIEYRYWFVIIDDDREWMPGEPSPLDGEDWDWGPAGRPTDLAELVREFLSAQHSPWPLEYEEVLLPKGAWADTPAGAVMAFVAAAIDRYEAEEIPFRRRLEAEEDRRREAS